MTRDLLIELQRTYIHPIFWDYKWCFSISKRNFVNKCRYSCKCEKIKTYFNAWMMKVSENTYPIAIRKMSICEIVSMSIPLNVLSCTMLEMSTTTRKPPKLIFLMHLVLSSFNFSKMCMIHIASPNIIPAHWPHYWNFIIFWW